MDFSTNRLGSNQKKQFLLWPGCLCRRVAAWGFDAISMKTFVMTVAALQYKLVNCCLLNTEFLDAVKLLGSWSASCYMQDSMDLFSHMFVWITHLCLSPDDTVHMFNKIFINDIKMWTKQVENFPVATTILPKQNVTQPDEGGLVVVPSAKTKNIIHNITTA